MRSFSSRKRRHSTNRSRDCCPPSVSRLPSSSHQRILSLACCLLPVCQSLLICLSAMLDMSIAYYQLLFQVSNSISRSIWKTSRPTRTRRYPLSTATRSRLPHHPLILSPSLRRCSEESGG